MFNGIFRVPRPVNEPVLSYAPGTAERSELQAKLKELLGSKTEVPMIIDGQDVQNGSLADMVCPHDHQHVLGRYHQANALFFRQSHRRGRSGQARVEPDAVGRPSDHLLEGGRFAGRKVSPNAQRGNDVEHEQDAEPGRNRCGLRADRLLAI